MPSGISIIINIASEKVPQEAPRKMLSPVTPIPVKKKIRKKVSSTLFTSENLKITISIGLSEVLKEDDASTIFKRVDKLLYKSKHNGKDKISC